MLNSRIPVIFFMLIFPVAQATADVSTLPSAVDSVFNSTNLDTVSDLSDRGKHFEAVSKYYTTQDQANLRDKLSAARSAWALGLVSKARELWDEVLADKNFQENERYRTILGRSIMELQESQYEVARQLAEKAAANLEPSDLRAQFWLVIAESLRGQDASSLAQGYYEKALADSSDKQKNEARYLLGECQYKLGKLTDARYSFASVEADSAYTAKALRRLVEIDLIQKNNEGVLTWINEGRESYPTEFSEGVLVYSMISALLELGRVSEATKELAQMKVKFSENDSWYQVAEAAVEAKRLTLTDQRITAQAE